MTRTLALVVPVLVACKPAGQDAVARPEERAAPTAPSRHGSGDVVDANVPLASGDVLTLESLRGKVVLLELSDATHRDAAVLADYARLVETHGDRVAIVVVSLDSVGWETSAAPYQLGWDPAGALAARLHAAKLPTVLVLDRDGRVAYQYGGREDDAPHAQAIATLEQLLK